jgi:hypothetical protein
MYGGASLATEQAVGRPADGEEHIDTVALSWTGQAVYIRLADPRCRTNAIWLDGADVQRR